MLAFEGDLLAILTFTYMICAILFQFLQKIELSNVIIQSSISIVA